MTEQINQSGSGEYETEMRPFYRALKDAPFSESEREVIKKSPESAFGIGVVEGMRMAKERYRKAAAGSAK